MKYVISRLPASQVDWLTVTVDKTSGVDFRREDGTLLDPHFLAFTSFVWRFLPVTSFWKILAFPVTGIYSLLGKRNFTFLFLDTNFRYIPLIFPSAICVSAVNINLYLIISCLIFNDDLGYSQESNCPFVVKYTWACWYLFVTDKNLFRLTGWSFRKTKFFDPPFPPWSLPP